MNTKLNPRSVITLLAIALGSSATAQIATLTLPTNSPCSVLKISGSHVVISEQADGLQHFVDVSTPANPVVTSTLNPAFGDQWFESECTSDFGGRLFTGHRFGGLNMLDVSNPLAPTTAASASTIYHYRGLRYRRQGNSSFLYYAEHNHGLSVYSVGANSLTEVWRQFNNPHVDANAMEIVGDHLYLFGSPYTAPGTRELRIFDISNGAAPALANVVGQWPVLDNVSYGFCQLRRIGLGSGILAARHRDGLELIDTSNPTVPVVRQVIAPHPQVNCSGSLSFPGSPLSIIYGRLGAANDVGWWYFVVATSAGVVPLAGGQSPMLIRDITLDPVTGRIFVVGIDSVNANRRGLLQIY